MQAEKTKIKVSLLFERIFGKEIAWSVYRKICVRRFEKAGIIFIHIPRAAGTSIAREVIGRRAGHFTAVEIMKKLGRKRFESMFSFAVTRNPYDRLVSAYHFAVDGGSGNGAIRQRKEYKLPTFSRFERFVIEWLPDQDVNQLDYVFQPQSNFVFDREELIVDYLGKVERLHEVELVVGMKLGRKIHFKRSNESKRYRGWQSYYDAEMKRVVFKLYEEDFWRLGYEP